ncbi:MAG TPA: hypothetical protein VN764_18140, partial [Polyangiaceae bacterium]|nr:hypothetical protein [Polyangiaceae bacterium]
MIVASSRLPVTLSRQGDNWHVAPSTGGLVTALSAFREQREFVWLGWPGTEVAVHDQSRVAEQLAVSGASAVFIEKQAA